MSRSHLGLFSFRPETMVSNYPRLPHLHLLALNFENERKVIQVVVKRKHFHLHNCHPPTEWWRQCFSHVYVCPWEYLCSAPQSDPCAVGSKLNKYEQVWTCMMTKALYGEKSPVEGLGGTRAGTLYREHILTCSLCSWKGRWLTFDWNAL